MKPTKSLINQIRCDLLSKSTEAEKVAYTNCSILGIKAIRQYPIYTGRKLYFADLYLPKYKTIIELDGGCHFTHEQRRKDKNRSAGLYRIAYHVLRINNKDARSIEKNQEEIIICLM